MGICVAQERNKKKRDETKIRSSTKNQRDKQTKIELNMQVGSYKGLGGYCEISLLCTVDAKIWGYFYKGAEEFSLLETILLSV